jgi:hypothetical protein
MDWVEPNTLRVRCLQIHVCLPSRSRPARYRLPAPKSLKLSSFINRGNKQRVTILLNFRQYITEISSTINQRQLFNELQKLVKFLNGSTRTKEQILRETRKLLKSYGVYVNTTSEPSVPKNEIYINASFDPELDEDGKPSIEITLMFNSTDKEVTMTSAAINSTVDSITKAVAHEEIHRAQYKSRDYVDNRRYTKGKTADQKYYGNTDEIEAFSHNIATELLQYTKYDFQKARTLLRNYAKTSTLKLANGNLMSPDFHNYIKFFGVNDSVSKRLVKRISHFIDVLEIEQKSK